jgi:phosphonate transport system substrate-binding protein
MIRKTLALAAAVLGASLLTACQPHQDSNAPLGTEANPLRFSILSAEDQASMQSYWQPLMDEIKVKTGLVVKPYYSSNYTLLVEAMAGNQVQAGWFSAQPAVEAIDRANAEVFARTADLQGRETYRSVILAHKGSGLTLAKLLKCDKTLTFGMGDPQSTSGTLAPLTYLFLPKHIDPAKCFKTVRSASHQANMLGVANGTLDAATNNTTGLSFYKTGSAEAQDAVAKTEVIWESQDLPESAVLYRKDLDPQVKAKLAGFFLNYGKAEGAEGERQRAVLRKLKYSSFNPATDAYLAPVIEMRKARAALSAAQH